MRFNKRYNDEYWGIQENTFVNNMALIMDGGATSLNRLQYISQIAAQMATYYL